MYKSKSVQFAHYLLAETRADSQAHSMIRYYTVHLTTANCPAPKFKLHPMMPSVLTVELVYCTSLYGPQSVAV